MIEEVTRQGVPIPADQVDGLLTMAARAPSILNSQPWLFRVGDYAIELFADPHRKLRADLTGREMLISCGAALYGLRLAIRSLGYQPRVQLLPDPDRSALLARVTLGDSEPITDFERQLVEAMPHRHTHRGPFSGQPLPRGLLIGLQHDAVVEHASLALIDRPATFEQLAGIVARSARSQSADEHARTDARTWARRPGSADRDGVPARAIPAQAGPRPGRLAQRDLDLGRGIGQLSTEGPPPAATAILLTTADTRADWLRAGQALHRLLAHAATQWVFASLHSQPLEQQAVRDLIRSRLGLPGAPQVLLQLGVARIAEATARRPASEVIIPPKMG